MRTILNIRTITLLCITLSFLTASAQTDSVRKREVCSAYMKATYIFEGKLDSSKYYTVKTGEGYSDQHKTDKGVFYSNFTCYLVEVDKVIKGNIKTGTIEIIEYADGTVFVGHDHRMSKQSSEPMDGPPGKGVYFCYDTAGYGYGMASYYKNSNAKSLSIRGGISSSNGEIKKTGDGRGITQYFSSLSEFYTYISTNYGIKIDNK
jgi:hypothetical protein